jgi:competence protein ComEC
LRLPTGIDDFENRCIFTYGTARVLLAGDKEGREEEYMASGPYTGPLTLINVSKLHSV